jgi:hypothetical protein
MVRFTVIYPFLRKFDAGFLRFGRVTHSRAFKAQPYRFHCTTQKSGLQPLGSQQHGRELDAMTCVVLCPQLLTLPRDHFFLLNCCQGKPNSILSIVPLHILLASRYKHVTLEEGNAVARSLLQRPLHRVSVTLRYAWIVGLFIDK